MFKYLRRRWAYMSAKMSGRFEENADPKVQLEQAINDAQDQHRRLVEQAANVVANQKQTELQLNRSMEELEKVSSSTRQALLMVEEAKQRGDAQKAVEYDQTAQAFANRLIATENQVNELKTRHLQTAQAADQAKAAVQQNSIALQQKLAERQKLLSQLDQAKMQEQLNRAMSSLSQSVDHEAPSLDQVRTKIEARYAKAIGTSELSGQTVESRMLEVQQAAIGSQAQSRLDQMRADMGLPSGTQTALGGGIAAGTPASELNAGGAASAGSSTGTADRQPAEAEHTEG